MIGRTLRVTLGAVHLSQLANAGLQPIEIDDDYIRNQLMQKEEEEDPVLELQ